MLCNSLPWRIRFLARGVELEKGINKLKAAVFSGFKFISCVILGVIVGKNHRYVIQLTITTSAGTLIFVDNGDDTLVHSSQKSDPKFFLTFKCLDLNGFHS